MKNSNFNVWKKTILLCLLFCVLLPVLASCGVGSEVESETKSTYEPKAIDYDIAKIDGEYYIIFEEEAYRYYSSKIVPNDRNDLCVSFTAPQVDFASAAAFKEAIETGHFDKVSAIAAFTRGENRVPLGEFDRLPEVTAPPKYETEAYSWCGNYYLQILRGLEDDEYIEMMTYAPSKKNQFDTDYFVIFLIWQNKTSERNADRNATVYYESVSKEVGKKVIQYEVQGAHGTYLVSEHYESVDSSVPSTVYIGCSSDDLRFWMEIGGFDSRPSMEEILSYDIKLAP